MRENAMEGTFECWSNVMSRNQVEGKGKGKVG